MPHRLEAILPPVVMDNDRASGPLEGPDRAPRMTRRRARALALRAAALLPAAWFQLASCAIGAGEPPSPVGNPCAASSARLCGSGAYASEGSGAFAGDESGSNENSSRSFPIASGIHGRFAASNDADGSGNSDNSDNSSRPPPADPPPASTSKKEDTIPSNSSRTFAPGGTSGIDIDALERQGAVIGTIEVRTIDVFDPDDPSQAHGFYRAVNAVHIKTREQTVRDNLLFAPGEPLRRDRLEETERNLRALPYIQHARVAVERVDGGVVTIRVTTQDSWTTRLGARLGFAGGTSTSGVNLSELNLLGLGKRVELEYSVDADRTTKGLAYDDLNVLGSHHRLTAGYQNTSDGTAQSFKFELPFYSFESRNAYGFSLARARNDFTVYHSGDSVAVFSHKAEAGQAWLGLSGGERNGSVGRWLFGYAYASDAYEPQDGIAEGLPVDQVPLSVDASGPFVGYQLIRDDFIKVRYFERFSRFEDYNLGTNISTRVQLSTAGLGGEDRELICTLNGARGFRYGGNGYVFAQFQVEGAVGGLGRAAIQFGLKNYYTAWPQQTFVMQVAAGRSINEGASSRFKLGGGDGLYGFESRFFDGPNLFQVNFEDRYHANKELFHAITFGFAGFLDIGNAWGGTTTAPQTVCKRDPFSMQVKCNTVQVVNSNSFGNFKADIGVALLADISPASGLGLVRINVAYPINGDKYDQPSFLISIGNIGF